jgi:diaminohydroxyphosphoribosylaminopyrimidine deaminase/5-amino-6-(5-phosphoribosylamino)uracil reductase
MARALQLAARGLYTTHPNPRVGCVLVRDSRIIAEGWHEYTGGPHAEINALNNASTEVRGATCYLTLEPCCHSGRTPPCTDALIKAGIRQVYAAVLDPNPAVAGQGRNRLEQAGIMVDIGLLAREAEQLNRGYFMRRTQKRPFVRCKLAMSLDGRTALSNGVSKWITGVAARRDVQRLRAMSAAIMTGSGTVIADDPSLTVRDIKLARVPMRVIIDRQLRCPVTARMLRVPGRTLIFTVNRDVGQRDLLQQAGAEVVWLDDHESAFLQQALAYLAVREEINEVLLESGATLAGSMLTAGLIDELVIYQAPVLLGDSARGLFRLRPLADMADRIELELLETRKVGEDVRFTYKLLATSN